jgi:acyl-CoA thioesterase-1
MSLEQGWVALLARQLADSHPHYRIVNASISGETSAGGLRRLPQLLSEHSPDLVIIELGGNDGLRGYPTAKLKRNLEDMVKLAQAAQASALLLPMEIPPNYGARYTQSFRASFTDTAESTGAAVAGFFLDGVATQPELMQDDGIHPNRAAQPLLLENLMPALTPLLDTP